MCLFLFVSLRTSINHGPIHGYNFPKCSAKENRQPTRTAASDKGTNIIMQKPVPCKNFWTNWSCPSFTCLPSQTYCEAHPYLQALMRYKYAMPLTSTQSHPDQLLRRSAIAPICVWGEAMLLFLSHQHNYHLLTYSMTSLANSLPSSPFALKHLMIVFRTACAQQACLCSGQSCIWQYPSQYETRHGQYFILTKGKPQ